MEIVGQQRIKIGIYWYNVLCPKCGADDKRLRTPYCKNCSKEYDKAHRDYKSETKSKEELIEFVDRVNNRNGMVSMNEMFVELITLFHYYYDSRGVLDQLTPSQQIEMMWKYIKELAYNWKMGIKEKPKLDGGPTYNRCYYEKNKEKIRTYQKGYQDRRRGKK